MGTETLIVFLTCGLVFLLIVISSWCRRKRLAAKESAAVGRIHETIINGQRTFRIATVARQEGRLALEVYEIRLPRPNEPNSSATITLISSPNMRHGNNHFAREQPPPPFSTAIDMPSPASSREITSTVFVENHEEFPVPPPRYNEITSVFTVSGSKVSESDEISSTTVPEVRSIT